MEFSLGQLPITKRRREAFVVLSVLGAALMIGAVPFRYSGNNVAILWLIGAEAFLAAGVMVGEVVFRRLGLFAGLLVGLHLVGIDFQQLMVARRVGDDVVLDAGVMFALCAVVFYLNTLLAGQRWRQFFSDPPDAPMLTAHSYRGMLRGGGRGLGVVLSRLDCPRLRRRHADAGGARTEAESPSTCRCSMASSAC